jgi:hypothetical protein
LKIKYEFSLTSQEKDFRWLSIGQVVKSRMKRNERPVTLVEEMRDTSRFLVG